jgi:hypothetical protein
MPEILLDNGHARLSLRPPERSQLASPSAPWSRRTAPFALLQAAKSARLNGGEMHEVFPFDIPISFVELLRRIAAHEKG